MNKGIRFTDEFKRDAVAQVVERGYAVSEVAERLGISTKSLYTWKAQFSKPPHVRAEVLDQAAEIKRLKRELARVTEERRVATRYDRSPTVFLSAIMLAATVIFWL
jgi:transposase